MTIRTVFRPTFPTRRAVARPPARMRDARGRRARAWAVALSCLVLADAGAASTRRPRAAKAASSPSTAQILAPAAATVPDALPTGPVWRCASSYSSHPCPGSDAPPMALADTRSETQRRQAEGVAARDKRLLAWYEAGRRDRETVASQPAGKVASSVTVRCTKHKGRSKATGCPSADSAEAATQRTAVAPAPPKPK